MNPRPPAPMTINTVCVAHEIVHAVWKALTQADPGRAYAGWSKTIHNHIVGTHEDGPAWATYQWHAMGTPGATAERAGFPKMGHLTSRGGPIHRSVFEVNPPYFHSRVGPEVGDFHQTCFPIAISRCRR